jgi:hypothetical protein
MTLTAMYSAIFFQTENDQQVQIIKDKKHNLQTQRNPRMQLHSRFPDFCLNNRYGRLTKQW